VYFSSIELKCKETMHAAGIAAVINQSVAKFNPIDLYRDLIRFQLGQEGLLIETLSCSLVQ
jgi:hypothetical protein